MIVVSEYEIRFYNFNEEEFDYSFKLKIPYIIVAADISPSYLVVHSRSETTIDFNLYRLAERFSHDYGIKYSFQRANSDLNAL